MLYFTAPYEDRKELLKLGAKWEFSKWRWFVEKREDYCRFSKWLDGSLISDELFILSAVIDCPHCGEETAVAALAVGSFTENFGQKIYGEGELNILYGFENITGGLATYFVEKFPLKMRFFEPYGYAYLVNGCAKCDNIISDDSLFCEESSPFFVSSLQKAQSIKTVKVRLCGDVALNAKVRLSFDRNLFKNLSQCEQADIKF